MLFSPHVMEANYHVCALVTLLIENIASYGYQIVNLELFTCFISGFTRNEYFKNAFIFLVFSYLNDVLLIVKLIQIIACLLSFQLHARSLCLTL